MSEDNGVAGGGESAVCIFCLHGENLTSTVHGSMRIRSVAQERQDEIAKRIREKSDDELLHYHMTGRCYRQYTRKKRTDKQILETTESDNDGDDESNFERHKPRTRASIKIRTAETVNDEKVLCIICNKRDIKRTRDMSLLQSEKKAKKLLEISQDLQDEVFMRIATLCDVGRILAARLYYHKNCMRKYEQIYDRSSNYQQTAHRSDNIELNTDETQNSAVNNETTDAEFSQTNDNDNIKPVSERKKQCILQVINELADRIKSKEIFALSYVRDKVNKILGTPLVRNREIKAGLIDMFHEEIQFCDHADPTKSTIFFHSSVTREYLAQYISNCNVFEECGKRLRDTLLKEKFDLDDKFCDDFELEKAWNQLKIPEEVTSFFSGLFNCSATELFNANSSTESETDSDDSSYHRKSLSKSKITKLKSLYQVMYYLLHNGSKKTPLHVLTGVTVHGVSKSAFLVKCLNRTGFSISYQEVKRHRTRLALYAIEKSKDHIPIPNHFNPTHFTKAAFDNFDHEECSNSGIGGTHDTVSVLFQNESQVQPENPKISETNINPHSSKLDRKLPCQELLTFSKPNTKTQPILITVPGPIFHNQVAPKAFSTVRPTDLIWTLSRSELSDDLKLESQFFQDIPGWSAFNAIVTSDRRPRQIIGFLPIFPHPVTEYSTVYSNLCNFKDVLAQLSQSSLPIFCDEGVYRIAKHIQMLRPAEFSDLVIMLGNFHLIKILLSCVGKYLDGSGIDDILVEIGAYGPNTINQVMKGTNYARSMRGFLMLGEALRRLQLEAFLSENLENDYCDILTGVDTIQETIREKEYDETKAILRNLPDEITDFVTDFEEFVENRSQESPLFKYYSNVVKIIQLIQDSVRGDREGNWKLHIETLQKAQPLFHVFDRSNYARWSSVYLNDMLMLPETHPQVYEQFESGNYSVKQQNSSYSSVAPDQGLEQTINRSQKSSSGIIGSTRKKEYVTVWELTYHSIHAITNVYRRVTRSENENYELRVHHDLSPKSINDFNKVVDNIVEYFHVHGNPFESGSQPLKNIVTQEVVDSKSAEALLSIFERGCEIYGKFCAERFENKDVSLSATISKVNLPSFRDTVKEAPSKSSKARSKEELHAQELIKLAMERDYNIPKLLSYELTEKNVLFDDSGMIRKETMKSALAEELFTTFYQGTPEISQQTFVDQSDFCLIVDVMFHCRKIKLRQANNFHEFAIAFCDSIRRISNLSVKRIDFVFDCYFENSPKSTERSRRGNSTAIALHKITGDTPTPVQEPKFWAHSNNKVLLQKYLRSYLLENGSELWPNVEIICSATDQDSCASNTIRLAESLQYLQRTDIEEADVRIMIHIEHILSERHTKVLISSYDTDVVVMALYHFCHYREVGLQELLIPWGLGAKKKIIPLHQVADFHGSILCSVLPALHHLTGSDYTSKVGRGKKVALKASPEDFLINFGRDISPEGVIEASRKGEEYLVQVWQKDSSHKTFNDLRYSYYLEKPLLSLTELPPTSNSIHLHILRAFYITHGQISVLNSSEQILDECKFGYFKDTDGLKLVKSTCLFPPIDDLIPKCTCRKCGNKACRCVKAGIPCVSFCTCKTRGECQNKNRKI